MSGCIWMFSDRIDDVDLEFAQHDFITYRMGREYYGLGEKPMIRMAYSVLVILKLLTISLGYQEPDHLEQTITNALINEINEDEFDVECCIMHHEENVDLIPANIELSGLENTMINVMSRERVLKSYVDKVKGSYDFVLIDCMPSLGMLTINALTAADSVLIPVQAAYLPVKGLQELIRTVGSVKKRINPRLQIEGILLTMMDSRTNMSKEISSLVYDTYSAHIKVFGVEIPASVRASETSYKGNCIYDHDPKGKVASAYGAYP